LLDKYVLMCKTNVFNGVRIAAEVFHVSVWL